MHIAAAIPAAIYAATNYMYGRLSMADGQAHDEFGMANYEIKCDFSYNSRVRTYTKDIIYATANHYCETNASHPELRNRDYKVTGYRTKFPPRTKGDYKNLLNENREFVPIIENTVFPFELNKHSPYVIKKYDKEVQVHPDDDRLVLGDNCLVLGIFTDIFYPYPVEPPRIRWCEILEKPSDVEIPTPRSSRSLIGSPERDSISPIGSPERYSISPNGSPERYSRFPFRYTQITSIFPGRSPQVSSSQ